MHTCVFCYTQCRQLWIATTTPPRHNQCWGAQRLLCVLPQWEGKEGASSDTWHWHVVPLRYARWHWELLTSVCAWLLNVQCNIHGAVHEEQMVQCTVLCCARGSTQYSAGGSAYRSAQRSLSCLHALLQWLAGALLTSLTVVIVGASCFKMWPTVEGVVLMGQ